MVSLRRDVITYGLVVLAGLALGFAAPRPGLGGLRSSAIAGPSEKGAPAELAASSIGGALEPMAPDLDGAESAELRALRLSEERFARSEPSQAQSPAVPEVDDCPDGALFCDEKGAAQWMAGLRMPDLPVHADPKVGRFVQYFSQSTEGRKVFRAWLKRSGRYRGVVAAALAEHLLPRDLLALVFNESGFSPTATSHAGAVGLWQFMPDTARAYGLVVESDYDERRSIARASEAGARHLSDLYERFGSWELALSAYDVGYQGMIQRVRDTGSNDYWTLSKLPGGLPPEATDYVPKILAIAIILNNLDHFGFSDTHIDGPVATVDLDVPSGAEVSLVARAAGTSIDFLHELNPELLSEVVPDRGRDFFLHIPSSGLARARTMLPRLLDRDTRDGLERRVGKTFDWGRDEVPHRVERADRDDRDADDGGRSILYRVGDHETLADIARSFGTSEDDVVGDNYLDPAAKLQRGMLLSIRVRGDVMAKIARKRAAARLEPREAPAGWDNPPPAAASSPYSFSPSSPSRTAPPALPARLETDGAAALRAGSQERVRRDGMARPQSRGTAAPRPVSPLSSDRDRRDRT